MYFANAFSWALCSMLALNWALGTGLGSVLCALCWALDSARHCAGLCATLWQKAMNVN